MVVWTVEKNKAERWAKSGRLQLKVGSSLSKCPCYDLRQCEPATQCLGNSPRTPFLGSCYLHFSVGEVMFTTAKLFQKLEIEIENHLSFSFLKLLDGPGTTR